MLPAGHRPATSRGAHYTTSCNTQSSSPEDERNNRPKHVELIGIINKPLLLHLVGCLYYLYTILIAVPLQERLQERSSMLRYTYIVCLVHSLRYGVKIVEILIFVEHKATAALLLIVDGAHKYYYHISARCVCVFEVRQTQRQSRLSKPTFL
jgi:hypothetical protein